MNRTQSVDYNLIAPSHSNQFQISNQLNGYQVLIQAKSKLQDEVYALQKQLRQKDSELNKQQALYEQRCGQLTMQIQSFTQREKMIRDMYERIFKAVKAAAENSCENQAFLIELGALGSLVNSFGQQVERCSYSIQIMQSQQTQTDLRQMVDKAIQVSKNSTENSQRHNRFQTSCNQFKIDLCGSKFESPFIEDEIKEFQTPQTKADAKMKPNVFVGMLSEFKIQQSPKDHQKQSKQLIIDSLLQQINDYKVKLDDFQIKANDSAKLEKDLHDSQKLIAFLKSAAQKQEESRVSEVDELSTRLQKLESRYAQKKRALKESSKNEVIRLKQQLAEALKVANLKSEETIKLKAEIKEQAQTDNQRKLVQMSIASSDVLRQSLMSFKELQETSKENIVQPGLQKSLRESRRELPLGQRVLNTESAPKNFIESHAKLFSKYVNSSHVGTNALIQKQQEICRVEVTLKDDEPNLSGMTGKFNSASKSLQEHLKTQSAQLQTDEDLSRYLILNDNSLSQIKESKDINETHSPYQRNSPAAIQNCLSIQQSAEPSSEAKQHQINFCLVPGTTPYFKDICDPMSCKQEDLNNVKRGGKIQMFGQIRESTSVNPCCFDNEIMMANALPSSYYDEVNFVESHTSMPMINFQQITGSVKEAQSMLTACSAPKTDFEMVKAKPKQKLEQKRGSRYNKNMIDNSSDQLVMIESSPMRHSSLKNDSEKYECHDETDLSQSPMASILQKRAAQKFGAGRFQDHESEISSNLTPLRVYSQMTQQTTPRKEQSSLRAKVQKEFTIKPCDISNEAQQVLAHSVSPTKKNEFGQQSDLSPLKSPTRLEQEEIDRIVDQIITHLRTVRDGEIPIELSEHKRSQSNQDCTGCKSHDHKVISCTHYHNHYEASPQTLAAAKLELYLGKLESRDSSIQKIFKQKEASDLNASKLQRKLKMLRERIKSVTRSRSSFQGDRLEQCLIQAQILLMQETDSESEKEVKPMHHAKSSSLAAAQNLQKAQLELRQKSGKSSQKQPSPVKKVFKDETKNAKLQRQKSGSMRTPLNLDVAQAFQQTKSSQVSGINTALKKSSILTKSLSTAETKSQTMPPQELKRQLNQQIKSVNKDFVFQEREKVFRSVINTSNKTTQSQCFTQKSGVQQRNQVYDSDNTQQLHYFTRNDQQKSTLGLQSFSIRKIEHVKGYLPVNRTSHHTDEEKPSLTYQNKVEEDSKRLTNQTCKLLEHQSTQIYHDIVQQQYLQNQHHLQDADSSFNVNEQLMMIEQDEDIAQSSIQQLQSQLAENQGKIRGRQVVERQQKVLVIQNAEQTVRDLLPLDGSSPVTIQSDEEDKTLMFGNETTDFEIEQMLAFRQSGRLQQVQYTQENFKSKTGKWVQGYYQSPMQECEQNRPRIKSQIQNPKQSRSKQVQQAIQKAINH